MGGGAALESFTEKLAFVTKALSLSRGRLGADLGVDKSVVSRWFSGARAPTSNNMAAITALIAARAPQFTLLDWDRDLEGLAAVLGVGRPGGAAAGANDLTISLPAEAAEAARARAGAYEGIWRLTYSAGVAEQPDLFVHSYVLVRKGENGQLAYKAGLFDVVIEGWATTANNQFFGLALNPARGTVSLVILNGVTGPKAMILDGLSLSCRDGLGGTPVVAACVSERFDDLTDDVEADDRRFRALLMEHPVAPAGSVPASIRDHLLRDIGPAAAAAGGDLLLTMPHLRSLARGQSTNLQEP
jgi:hypothetical protein